MKAFILLSMVLVVSAPALAAGQNLKCKVTKMHDYTYFEEGLSEEEYPYVEYRVDSVKGQSLGIGSHRDLTDDDGDRIAVLPATGFKTVIQAQRRGNRDVIQLVTDYVRGKDGKVRHVATLLVKEDGEREFRRIASLLCR